MDDQQGSHYFPSHITQRAVAWSFTTDEVWKGDTLISEQVIERKVEYTFALRKKRLLCTESLYVSDHRHESHYRLGHPKNHGEYIVKLKKLLTIEADVEKAQKGLDSLKST
jgi:hypothetical protein